MIPTLIEHKNSPGGLVRMLGSPASPEILNHALSSAWGSGTCFNKQPIGLTRWCCMDHACSKNSLRHHLERILLGDPCIG